MRLNFLSFGPAWRLWMPVLLALALTACGGGAGPGGTSAGSGSNSGATSSASSTAPSVLSVSPTTALAEVTTTFTVTGTNLPLTAVATIAGGSCAPAVKPASTGFTVVCTPGPVGQGYVAVIISTNTAAAGGYWLGQGDLILTGGPATGTGQPSVTGMTPVIAQTGVATAFTVTGTNLPLTSQASLAGGTCAASTNAATTSFKVVCTPGPVGWGSAIATIKNNTDAAGGYWIGQATLTVTETAPVAYVPLNDTGINANQCYARGSDVLTSCSSAAALALNTRQDGMIGLDVTNGDFNDGILGMRYSLVGLQGGCVKDEVTGLTWQRASTTLTRNGPPLIGSARDLQTSVNKAGLCGYTDWRIPEIGELQSLVLYGQGASAPTIDTTWFPLTGSREYMSITAAGILLDSFLQTLNFETGFVSSVSNGSGNYSLANRARPANFETNELRLVR